MAQNYRPYLTTEEIEDLCKLLSANAHLHTFTPALDKVYKKLYTLHLKVQSNMVAPGYTSTPRVSLEEKIGLVPPATAPREVKPSELRYNAYQKKKAGAILTPDEINLAETYEWENEL